MHEAKLWLALVLQYATDYKMVAAGNDSNGTVLYQKVGVQLMKRTHAVTHAFNREVLKLLSGLGHGV